MTSKSFCSVVCRKEVEVEKERGMRGEKGDMWVSRVITDKFFQIGSRRRRERLPRSILTVEGIVDQSARSILVFRQICFMMVNR